MTQFKNFFLRAVLALSLLAMLACCLVGCVSQGPRGSRLKQWMSSESSEVRILCTTAQIGDLVSEIGGDRIKNWVLIEGDLDPHSYELVKGDDEKIFRADIIFYNGLNLEHGASLSSQLRSHSKALSIGDGIAATNPEIILKRGSVVDPHLWMDISVWSRAIDPILEQLCLKDPQGAPYYTMRADLLRTKMETAHLSIKERIHQIPASKRYLLTSHDAFRYFTRGYLAVDGELDWQNRFAAPEGLAPDGQLSPVDIQRMIDFLKQYRICVIFPESNVSPDSIHKIASAGSELGLEIRVCNETLYGDSMSDLTYLEMMQKNAEIVERYLR